MAVEQRFWDKVDKEGSIDYPDCWLWAAYRDKNDYGTFKFQGKTQYAHRVSWILEFGPIPAGKQVLHHCDNPPCVNPDHLYLGTQVDNMVDKTKKGRGRNGNSKKTHCDKGHLLSGDNLYIEPTTGARQCKICTTERKAAYYQVNKKEIAKRMAAYNKANKEKRAGYNAAYRKANKKEIVEYKRVYRAKKKQ